MPEIWFWQRIVSPHIAGLATALAAKGCKVTYVAQQAMSADRIQQGWSQPATPGVNVLFADSGSEMKKLAEGSSSSSLHICQGIRGNGAVAIAQKVLAKRRLPYWVMMETVNDQGFSGVVKRLEYARLFSSKTQQIAGVLATGYKTAGWVVARGVDAAKVFPFAYFLHELVLQDVKASEQKKRFRFVFVGQLIERKQLGLLLQALSELAPGTVELDIVGTGPLEAELRKLAEPFAAVNWLGALPLADVPAVIQQADCLVLPSVHDGWGAVVSEALMVGTPAICSDACGSAGVVKASGVGGVFRSGDAAALTALLYRAVEAGKIDAQQRNTLAAWARCLADEAGAQYLLDIFSYASGKGERPIAPWLEKTWMVKE